MINCKNCGTQLEDTAAVCTNCGAAVETTYTAEAVDNSQYEGTSLASMIMGILSIVFSGIIGIILGALARSKASKYLAATGTLNSQAKAGKITGTIGLILGIVNVLLAIGLSIFYIIYFVAIMGLSMGMGY